MENLEEFLFVETGYGSGSGSGGGYGSGSGSGGGYGSGYGSGNGYGYGSVYGNGGGGGDGYGSGDGDCGGYGSGDGDGGGYGSGDGGGVEYINGQKVYIIDNIQTIITSVKGDIAKGYILNEDLSLSPCFVCKGENQFSHGATLHEAYKSLQEKLLEDKPTEERVRMFKEHFSNFDKAYPNKDLYDWHHILTGSCKMGRDSFAANHSIDVEHGSMTINEFIKLTKDSYNGDIIKMLIK